MLLIAFGGMDIYLSTKVLKGTAHRRDIGQLNVHRSIVARWGWEGLRIGQLRLIGMRLEGQERQREEIRGFVNTLES